ncbi:unnamed protein product, partial [Ectocarpus fasciculatus]
ALKPIADNSSDRELPLQPSERRKVKTEAGAYETRERARPLDCSIVGQSEFVRRIVHFFVTIGSQSGIVLNHAESRYSIFKCFG